MHDTRQTLPQVQWKGTEGIHRNTILKKLPLVATDAQNTQGAKSIKNKDLVRITPFTLS